MSNIHPAPINYDNETETFYDGGNKDDNNIYFDKDDYVYTNTKEALHRGKNIEDLTGERVDVFMLFNNRHEPPRYMTPLTPMFQGYYNPLNFESLRTQAEKIVPKCGPTIYLFVTGCVPAIVACVNAAIKYNKVLYLCHYDYAVSGYRRQKVDINQGGVPLPVPLTDDESELLETSDIMRNARLPLPATPQIYNVMYTKEIYNAAGFGRGTDIIKGHLFVKAKTVDSAIELGKNHIYELSKNGREAVELDGNDILIRDKSGSVRTVYYGWYALREADEEYVIG